MSFTGEFRHTIDAKGRLIVPSRLRDELTDDQVVLTLWPDGCIALWSGQGWRNLEAKLLEQRQMNPQSRAVIRGIAASAHQDDVDRQGRITIPQHLRRWAHVERDVVVTGALDHGEIWAPEVWATERAKVEEGRLEELAKELNF